MSGAVEEFVALITADAPVPLDRACLCIATAVRPETESAAALAALDHLAQSARTPDFLGVHHALFGRDGFIGNANDYGDPLNSMLDAVLARRTGLPILLSIVVIEVARRIGVEVEPIGMPGHFLVRDARSGAYCDPFAGGELLDVWQCAQRFRAQFGAQAPFDPRRELAPTPSRMVLARVLANLEQNRLARDAGRLRVLLDLHAAIPGLAARDRAALAERFTAIGAFDRAAAVVADSDAARASSLRARMN